MASSKSCSSRHGGNLNVDRPWILKPIVLIRPFWGHHPAAGVYVFPCPFYERFGTIARIRVYFWRWHVGAEFHYVEYLHSDY